jgi:hypothetical protein
MISSPCHGSPSTSVTECCCCFVCTTCASKFTIAKVETSAPNVLMAQFRNALFKSHELLAQHQLSVLRMMLKTTAVDSEATADLEQELRRMNRALAMKLDELLV